MASDACWTTFGFRWMFGEDGVRNLKTPRGVTAATVWPNGTWSTWDENGDGGENSSEGTVGEAKWQAWYTLITQGWHGLSVSYSPTPPADLGPATRVVCPHGNDSCEGCASEKERLRQMWLEVYEAAGFDDPENNLDADHPTLIAAIRVLRGDSGKGGG